MMISSWLNKTILRLKALKRRRQLDRDLDDEMAFHLAMRAAKLEALGRDPAAAQHAARRRFGNIGNVKEQSRAMWTFTSLESWWTDVRYAGRSLANNPGFTIVAVLAIALGIGVNAGIFSILNGVALRLLPIPSSRQVVSVDQIFHGKLHRNVHGETTLVSYSEYLSYRSDNHVFSGLLAYEPFLMATLASASPKQLFGAAASCNYFDVLQIAPSAGRAFVDSDCAASGTGAVVVISDELWHASFAADPAILGKAIRLNRAAFVVIGIAPPGFTGTEPIPSAFWVPFTMQPSIEPGREMDALGDASLSWLALLGRLRPGVSLEQTRADLAVISARLDQRHPGGFATLVIRPATFLGRQEEHSFVFGVGGIILAATGLVLLIACANVANLLLARASARHKEIALRLSIGASRWRLIRQLLTESLLLAFIGGACGSVIAFWSFQGISSFLLAHLPRNFPPLALNLAPDWHVLAYAFVLTVLTGMVFGVVPALQATRAELNTALKEEGYGAAGSARRSGRLRNTLVGVQVAVCMILLLAAALLMRGLYIAQTVDPGFRMGGVASISLDLRSQAYDDKRAAVFQSQLIDRLVSLPGVDGVAQAEHAPLDDDHNWTGFLFPGEHDNIDVEFDNVSPAFFTILEIPFVRGGNFTEAESRTGANVAIISEAAARTHWHGADPVGQTIRKGKQELQIVGVARDAQIARLGQDPRPYIYLPAGPEQQIRVQLLVHSAVPFRQTETAIRGAVHMVDPDMPVDVTPLADNLEIWRTPSRIVASLSAALGALALVLAITGVYGVASYASSRRIREIGIRVALGAGSRDVMGLLLRQVMRPVLVGAVVGIAVCAGVSSVLSAMLFGLRSYDPIAFLVVPVLLLGVALLASYLPARRAMRVDPVTALRYE
ncbi:MAG TPA: ABC transporter permease [Candidatus Dormibacteraeota bacterium]|nr:ABC transporter permease [Candidatus Dormibacteraeota bacterium]